MWPNVLWRYEPEELKLDCNNGWMPDFSVITNENYGFVHELIEYKPTMPTETYLEELKERFDNIQQEIPQTRYADCLCICMSPFKNEHNVIINFTDMCALQLGDKEVDMWKEQLIKAREFRFDLKHNIESDFA